MNFLNFLTSGSLFNFNLQSNANVPIKISPTPIEIISNKPSKEVFSSTEVRREAEVVEINESREEEGGNQNEQESKVELFTKQQQLINQYMHLNIQLLTQKLESLESHEKVVKNDEKEKLEDSKNNKKKIKKMTTCGHPDKQHYAKGMCNNCYHKYGRNKKPWNCSHDKLYANGMCLNCYINMYNKKKRDEKEEDREDPSRDLKMEESS